jgi:hypothetical protein
MGLIIWISWLVKIIRKLKIKSIKNSNGRIS